MKPPEYIINAAKRGLEFLRAGEGGDGLTEGTKDAARRMASGEVSDEKIIKASAWGARHKVDLDAGKNSNADDKEWPGAGAVAHYLWGINPLDPQPARDWFDRQSEKIQSGEKLTSHTMPIFLSTFQSNDSQSTSALVDESNNCINRVSLISIGEARGHRDYAGRQMHVDQTTLYQVYKSCLEKGSIKVKADHGSGVFSTAGFVDNFVLENGRVCADLHIYESEEEAAKIFEIARKNPTHIGISLEFTGMDEEVANTCVARCDEVITASLVSDPAANKSLFYSAIYPIDESSPSTKTKSLSTNIMATDTPTDSPKSPTTDMADTAQTLAKLAEEFANHMTEYKAFKKAFDDSKINDTDPGTEPNITDPTVTPTAKGVQELAIDIDTDAEAAQEAALKKAAEMGATLAIKAFASKLGVILPAGGAAMPLAGKKTFAQIVETETKRFDGDKNAAMLHCIKNFSAEYAESRNVR